MVGPRYSDLTEEMDMYYSSPFLIMNKKMADIDIDQFGERESRPEEATDKHIFL